MAIAATNSNDQAHLERGSIKADVLYVKKNSSGALPTNPELYAKDPEFTEIGTVDIGDIRKSDRKFSLAETGFQYERMTASPDVDYGDEKSVAEKHLPALEAFIAKQIGASSVKAYNHIVRNRKFERGSAYSTEYRGPAMRPHVDVSGDFAPKLFSAVQPDMYKDATENNKRWCLLNAWRPLKTVQRDPLAVVDKTTVRADEFLRVVQADRGPDTASWFLQKGSGSGHGWWYMSGQTPEDLLLFLQHDSDGGMVVPHSSFQLPAQTDVARESIEVRLIAVF